MKLYRHPAGPALGRSSAPAQDAPLRPCCNFNSSRRCLMPITHLHINSDALVSACQQVRVNQSEMSVPIHWIPHPWYCSWGDAETLGAKRAPVCAPQGALD